MLLMIHHSQCVALFPSFEALMSDLQVPTVPILLMGLPAVCSGYINVEAMFGKEVADGIHLVQIVRNSRYNFRLLFRDADHPDCYKVEPRCMYVFASGSDACREFPASKFIGAVTDHPFEIGTSPMLINNTYLIPGPSEARPDYLFEVFKSTKDPGTLKKPEGGNSSVVYSRKVRKMTTTATMVVNDKLVKYRVDEYSASDAESGCDDVSSEDDDEVPIVRWLVREARKEKHLKEGEAKIARRKLRDLYKEYQLQHFDAIQKIDEKKRLWHAQHQYQKQQTLKEQRAIMLSEKLKQKEELKQQMAKERSEKRALKQQMAKERSEKRALKQQEKSARKSLKKVEKKKAKQDLRKLSEGSDSAPPSGPVPTKKMSNQPSSPAAATAWPSPTENGGYSLPAEAFSQHTLADENSPIISVPSIMLERRYDPLEDFRSPHSPQQSQYLPASPLSAVVTGRPPAGRVVVPNSASSPTNKKSEDVQYLRKMVRGSRRQRSMSSTTSDDEVSNLKRPFKPDANAKISKRPSDAFGGIALSSDDGGLLGDGLVLPPSNAPYNTSINHDDSSDYAGGHRHRIRERALAAKNGQLCSAGDSSDFGAESGPLEPLKIPKSASSTPSRSAFPAQSPMLSFSQIPTKIGILATPRTPSSSESSTASESE